MWHRTFPLLLNFSVIISINLVTLTNIAMKQKMLFLLVAVAFFLSGCPKHDLYEVNAGMLSEHFISEYKHLDTIVFASNSELVTMRFYFSNNGCGPNFLSVGEDFDLFKSLAARAGDVPYNDTVWYSYDANNIDKGPHAFLNSGCAESIVSIDVTSSFAWDEDHPMNTPLNDIMELYALTPRRFIESGYSDTVPELSVFTKRLSEMTPEDYYLLAAKICPDYDPDKAVYDASNTVVEYVRHQPSPFVNINFLRKPTGAKTHTLTIIVTLENGKVFRSFQTISF